MIFLRCLIIYAGLSALPLAAQNPAKPPTPAPTPTPAEVPSAEESVRIIMMRDKLKERDAARKSLEELRAKLKAEPAPAPEEKARLEALAQTQATGLESLTVELHQELTGVTDSALMPEKTDNGLEAQFREVVKPALDMVHDLMKQPREIADMKRGVEQRKKEIAALDKALTGLTKSTTEVEADKEKAANAGLRSEIKRQTEEFTRRRAQKQSELTVFEKRLEELQSDRKSIGEYAGQLWSGFVLQTMLHLLLALAAFSGVLFLLRWVRRWLARRGLRRRLRASPIVARACDLLYHVMSAVAAMASAFVVLWVCGDWLLLTLGMLLVAGLVLLGRYTLPKMMDQARIILNLGGVREGERVVWNGLPWLVKRLHFSSTLQNPALTGGTVLLPVRVMTELLSRPFGAKERWFPTEEGDWVELSDGTLGKVVLQTPETVQVVPVGGSFKNYTTTDFLSRTPRSLSHNFRVQSRFGLDYRHLPDVIGEAPAVLAAALREGYRRLVEEEQIIRVNVELAEAGASALDLAVLADFSGAAAPHYAALHRLTQRVCVETAARHGWRIAFPQMVVHRAEEVGE